ncbi:pilus assembly protein PilM [Candidatus Parcubacteria bacterium]|nr:pilus assembly protein PilM [Candidatus Parcubacteria bacterium]
MGLFSSNYNYLGINLGTSSIKLVELANEKGVPKLVTYAFTDQSVNIIMDDSKKAINKTANILRQLCKEAKITSNKVITALPTFSVFSSIISLPQMKKKDLTSAIQWEAKKIIPMPIDEISLDWHILNGDKKEKNFLQNKKRVLLKDDKTNKDSKSNNNNQDSGDQESGDSSAAENTKDFFNKKKKEKKDNEDIKIFLTGAPKSLVKKYMTIFEKAELDLLSLETEIFSLIRSLVGNDKSTLMIIDIGLSSSSVSIIQNGFPIINRSIEVGGRNITEAISKNLNVNFDRGEQFKYDVGVNRVDQEGSAVFQSIEKVVAPIIDEIKYTIDFFKNQLSFGQAADNINNNDIEKIILTGGSSQLSYLPEYLSRILNKKVYIGDPFARIIYPQDLKLAFEDIGSKLSVAVGLAMREIE